MLFSFFLLFNLLLVGTISTVAQTDIKKYSFPEQVGRTDIGNGTIEVTVPFGTDLTNLVAKFDLDGGAVAFVNGLEQISEETPNDFTNPVIYTVIHEDKGESQDWLIIVDVAPNRETDFQSYSFPEQIAPAVIDTDRHTIEVEVAHETDVRNLVATFELSFGAVATVNYFWIQESGVTANDFTEPVTYRVTAEDGRTRQDWRVTVIIAPSPEANILSYSMPGQAENAIINEDDHTVLVTMPYGTNVTNLISSFTLSSGASATVNSVLQVSGQTSNDFTDPVIYRVTAYDGNTVLDWEVTVNVLMNDQADILEFSFPQQTEPSIISSNRSTVEIEMPFGTDFTNLVATFSLSPQASAYIGNIEQVSGVTANNFSAPVIYTVIAGDATEKDWTIVVSETPNTEKEFLEYNLPGQIGQSDIDTINMEINIDLPYGTQLEQLVATFELPPQANSFVDGILQESGVTPNDFRDIVNYSVRAGDQSTSDWVVSVNVLPNNQTDILSFSFPEQVDPAIISDEDHTVSIEVAHGTDLQSLTASFELSPFAMAYIGSTQQESGVTINDFSNPVIYTIHAGDMVTTQDWTVNVTIRPPSSETDILTYSIENEIIESIIDAVEHEVYVSLPEGTQLGNLTASFELSPGATAYVGSIPQVSGISINDYSSPVVYTIIAEDNVTSQDWTVYVSIGTDLFYAQMPLEFPVSVPSIEASVIATDVDRIDKVHFYYKRIEEQSWNNIEISGRQGVYEVDITRQMVGNSGIYYFFEAQDTTGFRSRVEYNHLVLYYDTDYPEIPNLKFGETINQYQIIALPLHLAQTNVLEIFDEMGGYNIKQWRIFHYDGNSTREFNDGFTNIHPGMGYWLIIREPRVIDTGEGRSIRIDSLDGFEMRLEPGWNHIGNPYNFELNWDNVIISNNNLNIGRVKMFYQDSLSEGTIIPPFRGGFVFLEGIQPVTVNVLPSSSTPNARKHVITDPLLVNSIDQPEWIRKIKLSNGTVTHALSGIGMHPEADKGKDRFDEVLLPVPKEIIPFALIFNHPDEEYQRFSMDVTQTAEQYIWEFEAQSYSPSQSLTLSWDNINIAGDGYNLILNHKNTEKIIDMKEVNSYTFTATGKDQFRIAFGNDEFISNELMPSLVSLGDGYPNPFTDILSIPFTLPENQADYEVSIGAYDITGNLVKQITDQTYRPGYYTVNWNSAEVEGRLTQGIYIIKMVVQSGKSNTVLTRKLLRF